jgi:hypothetical protein
MQLNETPLETRIAAMRQKLEGDAPALGRAPNVVTKIRNQSPMDLIESILRYQSQSLDAHQPDHPGLPPLRTAQQLAFALKHHLEGRSNGGH